MSLGLWSNSPSPLIQQDGTDQGLRDTTGGM